MPNHKGKNPVMHALRRLVIVLGVLILLATGLLGYFLLNRPEKSPPKPLLLASPLKEKISLSPHLSVQSVTAGPQSFLLHLTSPEGKQEILVIDQASGQLLSHFELQVLPR